MASGNLKNSDKFKKYFAVLAAGYVDNDKPQKEALHSSPQRAPRPVVLDVDTGRDDAWAILGALKELRLQAIVAGYGNITQAQAVRNALDLVSLGRRALNDIRYDQPDIKVWKGQTAPAVPTDVGLKEIERRKCTSGNGLCNLVLPASPDDAVAPQAANWADEFAAELKRKGEKIDYLACGPMTNLSCLIDAFERIDGDRHAIRNSISRVIATGGSLDPRLRVDFNFMADPASVQKVIDVFGADLVLAPFDETRHLRLTESQIQTLKPGNLAAAFCRDLMLAHARGWTADGVVMLHDPTTLLVAGEKVPMRTERVSVVLDGPEAGRLVRDDQGTEVRRLSILPHRVPSWRNKLLDKYLDLELPTFH